MGATAFTPGPWRTEIDNVFAGPDDQSVFVADCAPLGGPEEGVPVQIANARLIAAAPDLFAALTELIELPASQLNLQAPWTKARDALLKARGEA